MKNYLMHKNITLTIAWLFMVSFAFTQTQVGSDIDAETSEDYSGHSVSIDSDGSHVAIGALQNDGNGTSAGHVRIYEYSAGSWSQVGADIDGEAAGDNSGYSVSIDSDGSHMAIGAYRNDGNGISAGHVRVYEVILPKMTITATEGSDGFTSNDATLSLTFTSNEATSNFAVGDITVNNGTLSNFATTSSTVYTATFTPTSDGAVTIDVAANTFTNGSINNGASDQFNWTFDSTAPTITNTAIAPDNTVLAVTFSEAVYNTTGGSGALEVTDFTLSVSGGNATLSSATPSSISNSGNAYTLGLSLSGTPNGSETLTVVPSSSTAIYDGVDNAASTSQSNNTVTLIDQLGPTMTITAAEGADGFTSNDATIALTFTASEATANFVVGDISVTNGALSSFTATSSTVYTATFTPTADGAVTIDVAANKFTDSASNNNTAADQFNWTFDTTGPTMTITAAEGSDGFTSNDGTLTLTFTSNEATSNFVVGDITITNGALSNFNASSSTIYTATFTPTVEGAVIIGVAANTFTDGSTNNNSVADEFDWTFDSTGPTMTITAAEGADGFNSDDATLALTFTASEATTNFVVGDISVTNGALSNFAASSSTVYTATFTPTTGGAVTIDVAANTFTDGQSNNNTAADQFNWTYDTTGPTMVITSAEGADGFTSNDATLTLTFTSNEATTNFAVGDITVTNGTLSNFTAVSTTVYTTTFTPTADGAVTIDVALNTFTDGAGNNNSAATQFNWTFDSTGPTMTITAAEGSDGFTSNDATLALTFTASEATTNFAVGDISVTNGALSSFAATSSTVYTATFTPTTDGAVTIDIAANTFTDASGNNNSAATQFNWIYDTTGPTMIITAAEGSDGFTSNDATLSLTFTANEVTTNFAVGDVTVTNGALSSFAAISSTVYTATFTPTTDGAVTIDVAINTFTDASGNNNTAATQFNWTYDATGPTITITAAEGTDGFTSNDATLSLTFTSNEATTTFALGDIVVANGALSAFNATSSTVYTATFTPAIEGATTIDVAANTFTDSYGNNNSEADQFNWIYDITAPVIVISPANGTVGVSLKSNITLTFSEAIRNLDNSDLTDTNVDGLIRLKTPNHSGTDIAFDATIDTDKKVITIDPTNNFSFSQTIYVSIDQTLEDMANNAILSAAASFATADTNRAPVLYTIGNKTTFEDVAMNIVLSATDADDDAITFTGLSSDANVTVTIADSLLTFRSTLNWHGSSNITITATDDGPSNLTDAETFTLTVQPVNDAPTILALSPDSVKENLSVNTYVGIFTATDVDTGETFSYSFISGDGRN
ncbi:MAG: hypothetical protein HOC18_08430, partial [Candidatus Marinimicrobia bacterium]|nr:hypothetical protein [Candidatus Neomarinimicrobiota bacterium]